MQLTKLSIVLAGICGVSLINLARCTEVIYTFENGCSNTGTLSAQGYHCNVQSPAYISNNIAFVSGSGYISVNSVNELIGSKTTFSVELLGVSTSSKINPEGGEYFVILCPSSGNFLNLRKEVGGYMGISVKIGSTFYRGLSRSVFFDSSGTRSITVTANLGGVVTLYVNGVNLGYLSIKSPNSFSSPATQIYFNGYHDNAASQVSASIDEIHIHQRELSGVEVGSSYNAYTQQQIRQSASPAGTPPTLTPSVAPSLSGRESSFRPSMSSVPTMTLLSTSGPTSSPTHEPSRMISYARTIDPIVEPTPGPSSVYRPDTYVSSHNRGDDSSDIVVVVVCVPLFILLFIGVGCKMRSKLSRNKSEPTGGVDACCCVCKSGDAKMVRMRCGHAICREDVVAYLRTALKDSSMFPLKCPMHCEGCAHVLSPHLARRFLDGEETRRFQEYHDRALHGDGLQCIHCKLYIPLDRSTKIYMTACPHCTKVFCTQCKKSSHGSRRCPVDELDATLHNWKSITGAQQCPSCQKIIEKVDDKSCNHMVHKVTDSIPCCKERTDFCYLCGTEVLAGYPHDEVTCEGLNHFPDGVFQKCRKIIQQEKDNERAQLRKKARYHRKRDRGNATIVPVATDDDIMGNLPRMNQFDAFFDSAMHHPYPHVYRVMDEYNDSSAPGTEHVGELL